MNDYKCYKTGFIPLFRDKEDFLISQINTRILQVNRIVYHSYLFTKLFFVYLKDGNKPFPSLTKDYFITCFKLFYENKRKGTKGSKNQELFNSLIDFFNSHYKPTMKEDIPRKCSHLTNILKSEATDVPTNYNDHYFRISQFSLLHANY